MHDEIAIKYATRDLATLEVALGLTPVRDTCVQAGGSLGVWPGWLSRVFEAVYTFEPDPYNFDVLTRELAGRENVYKFQAALGMRPGTVALDRSRRDPKPIPAHPGLVHVLPGAMGRVPMITIDSLALPRLDLLCLDLEGFELAALAGARQSIVHHRPVILTEVQDRSLREYGVTGRDLQTYLRMLNYKFHSRAHADEIWTPC